MTDCGFFLSKEEAKKKYPKLLPNDTCSFKDMKEAFIDNNNKCPPECKFYPPRENYK